MKNTARKPRKKEPELILYSKERITMSIYDFAVAGTQHYNMAAGVSARCIGIRKEKVRSAVNAFENGEHCMQHVATVRGVEFYNNSKATNVNSTWFALESIDKKIILILGGIEKANDYSLIRDLVKEKVRAIVCLGRDNRKIHAAFKDIIDRIVDAKTAGEAVHHAFQLSHKGDAVLLSPACASFDLFKNYEDRGNKFIAAVKDLYLRTEGPDHNVAVHTLKEALPNLFIK
jgi:UDP-N-acetylmuramoylalanine--D-glutamate ligase